MEWVLDGDYVDKKGIDKYAKAHQNEVELCFGNLDRLIRMLNGGVTLQQAMHCGFLVMKVRMCIGLGNRGRV